MFDGLLKTKFYTKCKSDLKLTRTRVEMIRKKRNAVEKYLRKDVADLLKNKLDSNAYGRAEGLVAEMNRTSCYEFIDQSCEHILKNLSAMNKQRECPEECREAASSLMFAAARFADLPELRELRTVFSERYGNSLDIYVNKQFGEKLKSGPPSKDEKLHLLQDIAAESGLEWNSKVLENKLFNESANNENLAKEIDAIAKPTIRKEDKLLHAREFGADSKKYVYEPKNEVKFPIKKDHNVPRVKDVQVDPIVRTEKKPNVRNGLEEKHEEDKHLKCRSIPLPPYTKSEVNKPKDNGEEDNNNNNKPIPKSVRRRKSTPGGSEGDEREMTNKERAAQAQKILKFFDKNNGVSEPKDEEERMMDKLLHHYSRKKVGPADEKGGARKSRDAPGRSTSFPGEVAAPTVTETPKKHTRTASLQPELLNGNAVHVHPKMPDYDDFVARLALLRGK
ncbi:hypothetical protein ACP275_09G113500 [Erythranthe tilingii]